MDVLINLHRKGSCATFWIALAAVTVLGLFGDWIIGLWTHNAFEANHPLLFLMLVTTFLNVLWQTSWVVLMATNLHQKISVVFITSAAGGLIASTFLIPMFGVNGAGLTLVIAELPLLYVTINTALSLVHDNWTKYLKAVISNPILLKVSRS
jgi:O-antigen/teichoic acid export membrane protein